jgi:hypothetical protein
VSDRSIAWQSFLLAVIPQTPSLMLITSRPNTVVRGGTPTGAQVIALRPLNHGRTRRRSPQIYWGMIPRWRI